MLRSTQKALQYDSRLFVSGVHRVVSRCRFPGELPFPVCGVHRVFAAFHTLRVSPVEFSLRAEPIFSGAVVTIFLAASVATIFSPSRAPPLHRDATAPFRLSSGSLTASINGADPKTVGDFPQTTHSELERRAKFTDSLLRVFAWAKVCNVRLESRTLLLLRQ